MINNILADTKAKPNGKNQWLGYCPSHDDKNPSLAIKLDDDKVLLNCFAGCETEKVVNALGLSMQDLFTKANEKNHKIKESSAITPSELAESKGISVDFLQSLGIKQHSRGIEIPYFNMDGTSAARNRLRKALKAKDGSSWLGNKSKSITLYGLERLKEAREKGYLILVEGESDCWTLWYHDFPALGIPGASNTKKIEANYLEDIPKIYVVREPDQGGDNFSKGVSKRLHGISYKGELCELNLSPHKDPNEMYQSDSEGFKRAFMVLIEQAIKIENSEYVSKDDHGLICFADLKEEAIKWLWEDRIAMGKLTLLAGDPGLGKSYFTCYAAATVSVGGLWADGKNSSQGLTLIVSIEDHPQDTILPRLHASKADLNCVHTMKLDTFDLAKLLPKIEKCFSLMKNPLLLVIDPITALMGNKDGNSNSDVRGLLAPLDDLARRFGVAVLAVTHLNKNQQGKTIYRTTGSLAFVAAARVAWLLATHPENKQKRVLHQIKNNLAPNPGGLSFELKGKPVAMLHWDNEPCYFEDEEIMAVSLESKETVLQEAIQFLYDVLANGPVEQSEIKKEAVARCISWRTIQRAKQSLQVKSHRKGFGNGGYFEWSLDSSD